jgi:hypothetical protein
MTQALLPTSSGRAIVNSNPPQQRTAENPYVSDASRQIRFSEPDSSDLTYKVVTERFQYFLQDESSNARTEFGVIICDHRGSADDNRLRAHHQMLVHSSEFTSEYKNLIESVFLQPSHHSIGIQLADIIAGAVWRRFERGDDRFYKMAEPRFRRSRGGRIEGYGVIKVPKQGWV